MKKTALLFLAIALLLSGCASPASEPPAAEEPAPTATPEPPDERKTDEEFVAAVSRALQARWDVSAGYSPADLAAMSAAEYQSYLRACVDAEEKELGSIVDYRFLDADLASLAQQYYHALSLQRGGAEYARTSALAEYNATWVLGYNYRVAALWDLTRDFSLKVEKDYSSRLEELLAAHHEAKKQVAFREMTDRLPGELVYEPDPAASDETRTCYVGWITNTTGYDIKSLSIGISFLDSDGNILAQTTDWISDLHAGQRARSVIYAPVGDYAGMEYSISVYQ
ncbi:MAG: hypothetical protein IIU41_05410 [Oscillospiraceae bacterium]|nr:hypothetical protein [Oscillospiraceae bacterium]